MYDSLDPYSNEPESWYDTNQVCLNGHVINEQTVSMPEFNQDFCDKCGEKTITQCPNCHTNIKGYYHVPNVVSFGTNPPPSYCFKCGKPFPWTQAKLKAAKDITSDLEKLNQQEKKVLSESLDNIVKDTPQTPIAINRFKKLMLKAGSNTADMFREILVDVVSESVKKAIWG